MELKLLLLLKLLLKRKRKRKKGRTAWETLTTLTTDGAAAAHLLTPFV